MDELRLIDADLLKTNIAQIAKCCAKSDKQKALVGRILFMIDNIPTVDAEPVKHGAWIYGEEEWGQDGIFCNRCGRFVPKDYEIYDKSDDLISDFKYCPSCGARMEGDANG